MSYTKRQFINDAFEEIGVASYEFDLQPEMLQTALRRLDAMIATWNAKGIKISYPLPSSPNDSDLDEQTNVPDAANEAIIYNLAVKLASGFGKQASLDTKASARDSFDTLLKRWLSIPELQLPTTMPLGAGNKPWRYYDDPFLSPPTTPILIGSAGPLE